ncbi:hypothetical protein MMC26_000163 [Xylographa opegraphella]|nr:hypothetical protein [Xylographa opegraphella]
MGTSPLHGPDKAVSIPVMMPLPLLAELPAELLNQIVCHLETAGALLHISLTCKRLYQYVEENGYRTFVRSRFPSVQTPPYWKDAAHALTTLSKAWDKKAFVARSIYPEKDVIHLPRWRSRQPPRRGQKRQTMGYQPVIDCYVEQTGNSWSARDEILAWGAGAELNLRLKGMGDKVENQWRASDDDERTLKYDQFHHRRKWITYKDDTHYDGRDDITSVNLLRPWQKPTDGAEHLIIGRASGELVHVCLSNRKAQCNIVARFATGDRRIQSAHVSSAREPLLAACLSTGSVVVYPVFPHSLDIKPCSEIPVIPVSTSGRTWATSFLRPERLAIGIGPSTSPLHIYDVSNSATSSKPLRKFSVSKDCGAPNTITSSVYAIVPLEPSSQASGTAGDVFMSGWYDGSIKVHDLRSPDCQVNTFTDPVDTYSAIYSLLPIGRERFVAGGARHSIMKIFDFRMSGNRRYFAANAEACSVDKEDESRGPSTCCQYHLDMRDDRPGYNTFLDPSNQCRRAESPVYSLASAAPYSPHIYAGLEGRVVQLDVVEVMDRFPDQSFGGRNWSSGRPEGGDLRERYDPEHRALKLAALEHTTTGSMKLRLQAELGKRGEGFKGWDARWGWGSRRKE